VDEGHAVAFRGSCRNYTISQSNFCCLTDVLAFYAHIIEQRGVSSETLNVLLARGSSRDLSKPKMKCCIPPATRTWAILCSEESVHDMPCEPPRREIRLNVENRFYRSYFFLGYSKLVNLLSSIFILLRELPSRLAPRWLSHSTRERIVRQFRLLGDHEGVFPFSGVRLIKSWRFLSTKSDKSSFALANIFHCFSLALAVAVSDQPRTISSRIHDRFTD